MKRLLVFTLALAFIISFVFSTPVYSEQHEVELQEENEDAEVDFYEKMKQAMQEQKGAVEANEVLMNYFCQGELDPIYPEYFSGRYIKDNKLYICYVGDLEKVQEELEPVFGDLITYVVFERRSYSYHYLEDYLNTALVNLTAHGCNIIGYGISEQENCVKIYVDEKTTLEAKSVLYGWTKAANNQLVLETREYTKPTASVTGGMKIYLTTDAGNIYATLGICGTYNNQPAFITCGHYMEEDDSLYYNGTLLGVI